MARDLSDLVADNRRRIQRTNSRFVAIDPGLQNGLFFGEQTVITSVSTVLQKRASGSSDPWVDAGATRQSGAVTLEGHALVAASMIATGSTPNQFLYGDGTTDADRFDTSLANQLDTLAIDSSTTSGGDVVLTSAATTSNSWATSAFEVGVDDGNNDLLTREVYGGGNVDTANDEVRFKTTITVEDGASGEALFTDAGLAAIADSVLVTSDDVFRSFAFSDTSGGLDASDTSLPGELFRNSTSDDRLDREVVVSTRITTTETPDGSIPFDIVQAGITDETDTLVWGSPSRAFTVESDTEFTAQATVTVRN